MLRVTYSEARDRLSYIEAELCSRYGKDDAINLVEKDMSDFEVKAWHSACDLVSILRQEQNELLRESIGMNYQSDYQDE